MKNKFLHFTSMKGLFLLIDQDNILAVEEVVGEELIIYFKKEQNKENIRVKKDRGDLDYLKSIKVCKCGDEK